LRRPFSHVGIYVGDHRFIHAPARGGNVEIVNMSERYWNRRYNGARRLEL
jgi:cell wall-associated NlpC family hydrolase